MDDFISQFPLEIHGHIADFCSSVDLVSYLCVSKATEREVERVLYRVIRLKRYSDCGCFIASLTQHPHRRFLVRHLEILFYSMPRDLEPPLVGALRQMEHLEVLHICTLRFPFDLLLDRCTFRLRTFVYLSNIAVGSNGPTLRLFLTEQSNIRKLRIKIYSETIPLPPTALPKISILHGPARLAQTVLPGRSIERLFWGTASGDYFRPIRGPHYALRVLKILGSPLSYDLPSSCPNLRYLEFAASPSEPGIEISLRGLVHLHTVQMQPYHATTWAEPQAEAMGEELISRLVSLRAVRVPMYGLEWWKNGAEVTKVNREMDYSWLDWNEPTLEWEDKSQ